MLKRSMLLALGLATGLACSGETPSDAPAADPSLALLGGDTTIFDDGDEAFNYVARNASPELRSAFQIGDGIFSRNWVAAPATAQGSDGLGPTFNATSCSGCHDGDGRGPPPVASGEPFLSLFLRLSVPGTDEHGAPKPDPSYGSQFNHQSILGVPSEGEATVTYVEVPGMFADGEPYSLRKPTYTFAKLNFGPLDPAIMVSPRIARQLVGLGLLEAVSEETILANADAQARLGTRIGDTRITSGTSRNRRR